LFSTLSASPLARPPARLPFAAARDRFLRRPTVTTAWKRETPVTKSPGKIFGALSSAYKDFADSENPSK
jgi:hypothetical protein